MIEHGGTAFTDLSDHFFGFLSRFTPRRAGRWFVEPRGNGRGLLVCVADLALVAFSLLSTASFFATSAKSYVPAEVILIFLPLALAFRGLAFQFFGIYDRSFRHAGIADAIAIAKAVATSSLALYFASLFLKARDGVFLSGHLFIGDAIALFLLLSAFHFGARIYNYSAEARVKEGAEARRVVIIGAGDAGASVLKELLDTPHSGIIPVALVDDDPAKIGTLICGVPVVGGLAMLSDILFTYQGSEVLICIPSATREQRRRILAACLKGGVPVRTLPSLDDLLTHHVSTRDLRAISIEEALQRERFVPDHSLVKSLVGEKWRSSREPAVPSGPNFANRLQRPIQAGLS